MATQKNPAWEQDRACIYPRRTNLRVVVPAGREVRPDGVVIQHTKGGTVRGNGKHSWEAARAMRKRFRAEIEEARDAGRNPWETEAPTQTEPVPVPDDRTVGELLDEWLAKKAPLRKTANGRDTDRQHVRHYLLGLRGHSLRGLAGPLLTTKAVDNYVTQLLTEGCSWSKRGRGAAKPWAELGHYYQRRLLKKGITPEKHALLLDTGRPAPLDPETVAKALRVLREALNMAVAWGWADSNPAQAVASPKPIAKKRRLPDADALRALLEFCDEVDEDFAILLRLGCTTGRRPGEVTAVQWPDIDLDAGETYIVRSVGGREAGETTVRPTTKNEKLYRIALDPDTVERLRRYRQRCEERAAAIGLTLRPDAYVVSATPDGSEPWSSQRASRKYRKVRDLLIASGGAAARLAGVRLYDATRHNVATRMLEGGASAREVADYLGTSERLIEQRYGHAKPAASHHLAQSMGTWLGKPA